MPTERKGMSARCWVFAIVLTLVSASVSAAGNYLRNDGARLATQPQGHLQAGGLWRVICPALRGRAQPDRRSRVVHVFPAGTVLQADVGRGGSDEVLLNSVDREGGTWMRARTRAGKPLDCYVRADTRTLAPLR